MTKILIVEDDRNVNRAMTIRLKKAGYEIASAHDGLSGMTAVAREKPDLVILDISMPAGNGFVLAQRIHDYPESAGTPIIFATASKKPEMRQRARELGAAAFITKPFESTEVLDAIEKTLQKSRALVRNPSR